MKCIRHTSDQIILKLKTAEQLIAQLSFPVRQRQNRKSFTDAVNFLGTHQSLAASIQNRTRFAIILTFGAYMLGYLLFSLNSFLGMYHMQIMHLENIFYHIDFLKEAQAICSTALQPYLCKFRL